jgi:hypothetical protein
VKLGSVFTCVLVGLRPGVPSIRGTLDDPFTCDEAPYTVTGLIPTKVAIGMRILTTAMTMDEKHLRLLA